MIPYMDLQKKNIFKILPEIQHLLYLADFL